MGGVNEKQEREEKEEEAKEVSENKVADDETKSCAERFEALGLIIHKESDEDYGCIR